MSNSGDYNDGDIADVLTALLLQVCGEYQMSKE
jgi:hypothetical protein